jgi:type II secretory pathway component PulC
MAGLGLGDVVLRINGQNLEHPEEAHRLFESLPRARDITIDLLRGGQPQRITLPVVDAP